MRHFTRDRSPFRVRLACVKHAASVQSEPESNSPVQICSKDLRWTEIRISKFLPVRYSLVNEPHRFTRREAVVYAASFSLSTSFFHFRESFFRGPVGATRWREGDLCLIFKPASRTFLPSGKISFPAALSDVAGSLARTALCAFSTPPSSIFPQKILRICSLLTDYSINIPKRHRKMFAFSCKPSVFLARKVSPLRVEGITDLPAFNNLCFLPFSLLFPVTQAYQGIWHCLIPLPGRSRPSRFHSCSSATPETAGERCLPPLRPW